MGIHFKEANKQLHDALHSDKQLRTFFEKEYPSIVDAIKPSQNGIHPSVPPTKCGLTWHHNAYEEGLMELVPTSHHKTAGLVQQNLHPNRKGGMEIWGGGRKKNSVVVGQNAN